MAKKNKLVVLGCTCLLFVGYFSINFVSQSVMKSWDNQPATLIATDNNFTELGDGAHAIPINAKDVLQVGEKSNVFELEITLNNAGYLKSVENTSGAWDYWFVEFTGENISDEILYGVDPGIGAQLQYLQNGSYAWQFDKFNQRQCDDNHVIMDSLKKGGTFHCRFIYMVPADKRNIYWVYAKTDNIADGTYEEHSIVFQIR